MNEKIFKAYDIRGVYPEEINKEEAFKIGRGIVSYIKKERKVERLNFVVGRDNRNSSPILAKALKEGIKISGGNIIDIGLSTTPMFYFAVKYFKANGGAMVTASHNPPKYNGIKAVRDDYENIAKGSGGEKLKEIVLKEDFIFSSRKGKEKKVNILSKYLDFNFQFLDRKNLASLKVVVDTANAAASPLIPFIQKKLKKVKFYHLFSKLDGNFPNHDPDPIVERNLKSLVKEVLKRKADFGIAFDGDGDRIVFVDERGRKINGDIITALLAKIILRERKGEKILFDIRSSKVVQEKIKEFGGKAYISKTGHSFIKPKMKRYNIYFGGEFSGHYYFGPNNAFETPLFVLFKLIEEVSREKKPLSEIIKPFQKYVTSGEINFEIENRKEAVKKVEDYCRKKELKISRLDGVKGEGKDFWFLVRSSNTEPLLRLVVEAKNKKNLIKKVREIKNVILK